MLIDGKTCASKIRLSIKKSVDHIQGRKPGLAFILIGDNPSSRIYVKMKTKACDDVGFVSKNAILPESISEKELLKEIDIFNEDKTIDGILVQQPFPPHLNRLKIIQTVLPEKDVDGFHPLNQGKALLEDDSGFLSCTPFGIITLLEENKIPVEGKHVVIIGRSPIVGKPLAAIFMQKKPYRNATVTIAHSKTEHLAQICKSADILVAAIGIPKFVKSTFIKKGAVVIDVGINRLDGTIVGDVDFENVAPLCSHITPVPGGVGPMTIAMLLSNTLLSYQRLKQ